MNESLVTSLPTSKLLLEKGFPQDSYFVWCEGKLNPVPREEALFHPLSYGDGIAAPLTDELLAELPQLVIGGDQEKYYLKIGKGNNGNWFAVYERAGEMDYFREIFVENKLLPEALAQLYIKIK